MPTGSATCVQWVTVGVAAAALLLLQGVLAALYYLAIRRRNVTYLVDFYSFRPPDRRAAHPTSTARCQGTANLT